MPDFVLENVYDGAVAGVDEAGRGPLAGPVVAASVVLNRNCLPEGIEDSKKLSARRRGTLYELIMAGHDVGVGIVEVEHIDRINILQATLLAMTMAVEKLAATPSVVLVDGNALPKLKCPAQAVVKGDTKSLSIAAASIIAKVTRDAIMEKLHGDFPHYDWKQNMGYGTAGHLAAIKKHGITRHHRQSFGPVRKSAGKRYNDWKTGT